MKILVDRLTSAPQPFLFEGDSGWWRSHLRAERGLPREVAEPLRFALEAHRMGEDLYLEGCLEGAVELECSRCLSRYRQRLREPFRLVLEPAGARAPADPEEASALARYGVCLGEELEAGWFRGNEIHLEAFFAELVALALPVKPLCREDCAGLCPRCGADLATSRCGCSETKLDSPFAVLASLRGGASRERS